MAYHLEHKRPPPIDAAHFEFPEPLTQSPSTAETPILIPDDIKANPHLQEEEVHLYTHTCDECSAVFDCVGDEHGNHAVDLCICEQAVAAYPEPHLIFYCSYECSIDASEPDM